MTPALQFAFIGMKASLDQLERTGEQLTQLVADTNVARDMVELSSQQRTYEANAAVARTADQVLGAIINILT